MSALTARFGPAGNCGSFSKKYKSSPDAPAFLCESDGTQAEDALTMKRQYQALLG